MNSNVFFQPFVGKDYAKGGIFGKRIMVLGESHYCEEGCKDCGFQSKHPECIALTNGVVKDYLEKEERQDWMRTFVKFERSLVGEETDREMSRKIWDSVVFYNYLQVAMGDPREAGSSEQYQQASKAFFEVLDKYQPEVLIVWGHQLWRNLPEERWIEGEELMVDGQDIWNGAYCLANGKRVKALAVYHPSVGYSWDFWHRVIGEYLK